MVLLLTVARTRLKQYCTSPVLARYLSVPRIHMSFYYPLVITVAELMDIALVVFILLWLRFSRFSSFACHLFSFLFVLISPKLKSSYASVMMEVLLESFRGSLHRNY